MSDPFIVERTSERGGLTGFEIRRRHGGVVWRGFGFMTASAREDAIEVALRNLEGRTPPFVVAGPNMAANTVRVLKSWRARGLIPVRLA